MGWQEILRLPPSNPGFGVLLGALATSMISTACIMWMYNAFYGSHHIGAGVNRAFLLGGPAITILFLITQSSIPLALGALGILSVVRFRVPVKDPAEAGFILLILATSLASATLNYWVAGAMLALALAALAIQSVARTRGTGAGRGYLLASLYGADALVSQQKLSDFLAKRLPGVHLESVSSVDGRLSLHYQFSKNAAMDWGTLLRGANEAVAPTRADILVS